MIAEKNIIQLDAAEISQQVDFSLLKNKTILVTGASGLLGIYFLACLQDVSSEIEGLEVIAVIRTSLPDFITKNTTVKLTVCKGDLSNEAFCNSLPSADFIIHAAGFGQPLKFLEEPVITLKLNTLTTFKLFDKLKPQGSFLFVSSSEVYSGLETSSFDESQIGTTNTTHPRACYIEGKRGGEAICNASRFKGIKASSVRLAHTYGPGAKLGDQRVLLSFIEKGLHGKITLLDHGAQKRTFCYIADAIEVMWKILFSTKEPIYNLSGNAETTILKLAEEIGEILRVPVITPPQKDSLSGAPENVNLNMDLVKKEFGKSNYIPLKAGLKRTIDWYLNHDNQV